MITCTFEHGASTFLRHVTVNAILTKDGKILLGKRGTYKGRPLEEMGKWALIGGFVDRDENLEQAIRREIREECGCEIGTITLFHIKDNPDRKAEDRQNIEFVYIIEAISEPSGSDEEVTCLEWFAIDQLPPIEDMAFDHRDDLVLYKKYLSQPFPLPFIGKV